MPPPPLPLLLPSPPSALVPPIDRPPLSRSARLFSTVVFLGKRDTRPSAREMGLGDVSLHPVWFTPLPSSPRQNEPLYHSVSGCRARGIARPPPIEKEGTRSPHHHPPVPHYSRTALPVCSHRPEMNSGDLCKNPGRKQTRVEKVRAHGRNDDVNFVCHSVRVMNGPSGVSAASKRVRDIFGRGEGGPPTSM